MALLRLLCVNPGMSRVDLSASLSLARATVTVLVRELLDAGWICEREEAGPAGRGRQPMPLFIAPSPLLLGAEVGVDSVRVVATSLTGEVRFSAHADLGPAPSVEACVASLVESFSAIRKQLGASQGQILGIGVGLPGGVDAATGVVRFAPNLGWTNVAFGASLTKALDDLGLAQVPVFLQSEADVAAVGELEFHAAHAESPLIYVSLNVGVGAGVIVNGRLITGRGGLAGEIGHVILQLDGPLCSCGRHGCAEALTGLRAMLPEGYLSSHPTTQAQAEVQSRLAAGDAQTLRAIQRAGTHLGGLLHNLSVAYDPCSIVLGGACVALGEAYLQPATQALEAYALASHLSAPRVRVSSAGVNAVAEGAAAFARHRLTRPVIPSTATRTVGHDHEREL